MGLIKVLTNSTSQTFGNQLKEYITCPNINNDVLIQRGRVEHGEDNQNSSEEVISNGSTIVVPEGMAMMMIDNGEIKEFSAVAGTFTYDMGSEPSIFTGSLTEEIKNTFKTVGKSFTYGGQPAKAPRVYYVNLLTITGNKFRTPQPKKIKDEAYGVLEVTFFGEYAFKVQDPIKLVSTVIGEIAKNTITYNEVVGGQLQSKFIEKITVAISDVIKNKKIPFEDFKVYGNDISFEMNNVLEEEWKSLYGLEITNVAFAEINLDNALIPPRVNKIDTTKAISNKNIPS